MASSPSATSGSSEEGEKYDVGRFCAMAKPATSSSDASSGSSDLQGQLRHPVRLEN
jgi:hypothetical protein